MFSLTETAAPVKLIRRALRQKGLKVFFTAWTVDGKASCPVQVSRRNADLALSRLQPGQVLPVLRCASDLLLIGR